MSSKTKTTAPKEDATPALMPKLRFPEFREAEEWKIKKLSTSVQLVSGMHLSPEQYGTEGAVPYFTGPSDFTNSIEAITKRTCDSVSLAKKDDTLITVKGSGVGEIWYLTLPSVAIGRQLMAVRALDASSRFVFQLLLTKRRRFEDLAAGNLIPGLARGDILDLEAPFPPPAEQQKIAECLCSVDELIAAQARKLEALKTHKQGLMQQLFPREGETQPRLRFPEFQNAGEWVRRRVGDFANVAASGDLDPATFSPERSDGHCFPIYSNAVEKEGIYGFSSVAKCKANSVTITARGTLGRAFLRRTDFVGIGRLIVVSNFEGEADSAFLTECWDHLAVIPQEVTSIPQLTAVTARATALPFPSLPEQHRIANCLTSLDDLIAAQTQKLEALKTHKRGLMQQLFPSPEEQNTL
jgi:type I restriction enzyme S subunit